MFSGIMGLGGLQIYCAFQTNAQEAVNCVYVPYGIQAVEIGLRPRTEFRVAT